MRDTRMRGDVNSRLYVRSAKVGKRVEVMVMVVVVEDEEEDEDADYIGRH